MDCRSYVTERKKLWNKTKDIEVDKEWRELTWSEIADDKTVVKEIIENPWLLMEMQFIVTDKEFNELPFFLNEVQRDLQDNTLVPMIREQEKGLRDQIKIKVLKGRQSGISTYITAFQLCLALTQKGFRGFTMAHDADSTKSIFDDIAKGFFDTLIDDIKEKPKKSNAKELVFEKLNSAWRIATAGSKGAGRGKKLKFLHNSEKAFWDNMRKNAAAISQALTPTGSIEIDESTAQGYNEFKEDWDDIKAGRSKWVGVFLEWYRTKEYRLSFDSTNYTKEEFLSAIFKGERFRGVDSSFMTFLKSLIQDVGLDINQVHWYFDKRTELRGDVFQEYPCTDEQAFLLSGRPYFDVELIDLEINKNSNIEFRSEKGGKVIIYEEPIDGDTYVIGSDVAEGLDDGDSSTITVINARTKNVAMDAEYTMKPDDLGRELVKWAEYYNGAMIGVERNNHGHSTINTMVNELGYRNLFVEVTIDKIQNKSTKKIGWLTTEKSKYLMLDELDIAHRKGDIIINSVRALKQMRGVQKINGKVNVNGKDIVVSTAIANQMLKYAKTGENVKEKKSRRM